MNDWRTERLQTLGEFRSAGADKLTQPGELPVKLVNYMDVYHQHRIHSGMDFQQVTATQGEIRRCDLKRNDILFTPSSETPDDIAHAAVVAEDVPGTIYSYHLVRFRLNDPAKFDTDFLGYLFNQPNVYRYFWARASGLTRFTLNRADFNNLSIFYPSRHEEQAAIANALSSVDAAMIAARTSIHTGKRLKEALMRELLSGRLRPDGSIRGKADLSESPHEPLPKTWRWARVKDFGSISTGKTPPTDIPAHFSGSYPFITPGDMGSSKWIGSVERTLSESGSRIAGLLPEMAVCVVCIGATIGKVGLTKSPSSTNQQINSVVCGKEHSPEYLYYAIELRAKRLALIAGVNATPMLNKSEFGKFKLPMPADRTEEAEIAAKLSDFDELIAAREVRINALERLKKSLMQQLLTGKIRVPVPDESEATTPT